ncbi:MAG: glycosyltransferase [Bacteroidetes bacterium]|nr:MAG: glycosyltransferase [Bacteroidota bacterium]
MALFFLLCMTFYALFVLHSAWHFMRLRCRPLLPHPAGLPAVTVIIPARNEAACIGACLQSVLAQEYPPQLLQVVLINDHSTDATRDIALAIAREDPRLQVLDLQAEGINSYKKAAILQGMAAARGELIVQTDADCRVPPRWVAAMVAQFEPEVMMVSGPVRLTYGTSLLEKFQSLESMGLVALGAGSLAAGRPNMCNGANLAYRKAAFEAVGGYSGIDAVASGDDELLMHKMHQQFPRGLRFAKCRQAVVCTPALSHWKALRAQRIRWVSKARFYQNKWINVVQLIFYCAFWGFPLLLLTGQWMYLGAICALKMAADLAIMLPAANFFHNLRLLALLPVFQPFYIAYVLWVGIRGNFVKTYQWKNREVR